MGYWGHLLVARSNGPLAGFREGRVFGEPEGEQRLSHDWTLLRIAGNHPPDLEVALRPLVSRIGAPALVAFVLDSDCAVIRATSPAGARWGSVVNRELAGSYDGIEGYDTPDHGLSGALRWAREAGLTPADGAVKDALDATGTLVEDVIDQLLKALGVLA